MRPSRQHHILHVDDNEDDRTLFAYAFKKSGLQGVLHSVVSASDAVMYLNRFGMFKSAMRPQLIILDLSLPRIDGRQFLEMVRSNLQFKSIPVIILTGSESYADMQRCRELQVDDYVLKPRTAQGLIELITSFRRWLSGADSKSPTRLR